MPNLFNTDNNQAFGSKYWLKILGLNAIFGTITAVLFLKELKKV